MTEKRREKRGKLKGQWHQEEEAVCVCERERERERERDQRVNQKKMYGREKREENSKLMRSNSNDSLQGLEFKTMLFWSLYI